jgi:hypothetical protein
MSVLATRRKGNWVNRGGIDSVINKADRSIGLEKIEPFLLADHPGGFIKG